MPLRLMKTILNELVKLKGPTITQHMSLVPLDNNPTIISYASLAWPQPCAHVSSAQWLRTVLRHQVRESAAGKQLVGSRAFGPRQWHGQFGRRRCGHLTGTPRATFA